jgi:hypothetical protein
LRHGTAGASQGQRVQHLRTTVGLQIDPHRADLLDPAKLTMLDESVYPKP